MGTIRLDRFTFVWEFFFFFLQEHYSACIRVLAFSNIKYSMEQVHHKLVGR